MSKEKTWVGKIWGIGEWKKRQYWKGVDGEDDRLFTHFVNKTPKYS